MKLSKLADLSQIIGAVAVIGTLIFIGVQINQNTKATKASIRQSIATNDITFLSRFLNSAIIAEARAKQLNHITLSITESEQLVQLQYVNFMVFEMAYYNYQQGFLDTELWERYRFIIAGNLTYNTYAEMAWKRHIRTFTTSFQKEVSDILQSNVIVNEPTEENSNLEDSISIKND